MQPAVWPAPARTEFYTFSASSPYRLHTNMGRTVCLSFFSSAMDASRIASTLCESLHGATSGSVLLVEFGSEPAPVSLTDWVFAQTRFDGQICFANRLVSHAHGYDELQVQVAGTPEERENLSLLLAHFARHYRFLILHARRSLPVPFLFETVGQADAAYAFYDQHPQSHYELHLFEGELNRSGRLPPEGWKRICCLTAVERVESRPARDTSPREIASVVSPVDPVHYIRMDPPWFGPNLRSVAREIGRCRVGLALSSGGAKGLAHVGVIQVLEEHGIEIDAVAGCSMGAYVGAAWCSGADGHLLERMARELERRWGLLELIDPVPFPWQGFLRGMAARKRLQRTIGDLTFSELVRTFRVVATHLETQEKAVFWSGAVAPAVHASFAIPGICVPVRVGEERFVDGGIVDPLPVDVLREMGIERVIAVNTLPAPDDRKSNLRTQRELAALNQARGGCVQRLYRCFDRFTRGSLVKHLLTSIQAAQMRLAEESSRRADLVIRPVLSGARWHDFTHPGRFIALGRETAQQKISEIQTILQGRPHERAYAHNPLAAAV